MRNIRSLIFDDTPAEMRDGARRYRSGLGLNDGPKLEALRKLADEYEAMADRWERTGPLEPPVDGVSENPEPTTGDASRHPPV